MDLTFGDIARDRYDEDLDLEAIDVALTLLHELQDRTTEIDNTTMFISKNLVARAVEVIYELHYFIKKYNFENKISSK